MALGPEEELARLTDDSADAVSDLPMIESLVIAGETLNDVVERAKSVLAIVVPNLAAGVAPEDKSWSSSLPHWFIEACAAELTVLQREAWLKTWRLASHTEKIKLEADRGWTLIDWLYAMRPADRAWRWWNASTLDSGRWRIELAVTGWPAPVESAAWLMKASGADYVDSD